MRRFWATTQETFLLLRRDKVFIPVFAVMLMMIGFAHITSFWATEDYEKILYDVGAFGIDLCGTAIAIFWGTKLIADQKRDGSLELQLAAPVSRGQWVIAKFIGLSMTLVFLWMLMMVIWQIFLFWHSIGWLEPKQVVIFAFQLMGWIVLGSIAIFLGSMAGQMTAMSMTVCLWILGLLSRNVIHALSPETPPLTREVAITISKYWDLQRFNYSEFATTKTFVPHAELWSSGAYGVALIALLVTLAAILFAKKDVAID